MPRPHMTPSSRRPTALLAFTVVLTALLTVGSSSRLTANTSLLPPVRSPRRLASA